MHDRSYDAVLIGANLSVSNGWLRNVLADVPSLANRVVITGSPGDFDFPVHSVLRKPIELDALIETIADCAKASD
jgi:hypothetical protein